MQAKMFLNDALAKNLIKADIKWKSRSKEESVSDRYGKNITVTLKNLSSQHLDIEVPCGYTFKPENDKLQNMLVTELLVFDLKPNESQTRYSHAYCCEAHDGGPSEDEPYKAGKMAKSELVQLANFIKENNYQDYAAQRAIWAVSDKSPLSYIYTDDTTELRKMIHFTGKLTGAGHEEISEALNKNKGAAKKVMARVNIDIPVEKDAYIWIVVHDPNNVNMKTLMTKTFVQAGKFQKNFNISSVDLGAGLYTVRIYSDNKAVKELPVLLEM